MKYPEGSIKSYEELCAVEMVDIYCASSRFKIVDNYGMGLSLTLAKIRDGNIPKNGYNDWFLFTNEAEAKLYAGVK